MYKGKIPFDSDDQPLVRVGVHDAEYVSGDTTLYDNIVWKDNKEFHTIMRMDGERRVCGRVSLILKDNNGKRYNMVSTDVYDMMKKVNINYGTIEGWWIFKRKGVAYSLVCVGMTVYEEPKKKYVQVTFR